MKGILLAGGSGTRLRPCTNVISKQLLPVYDKPMIYYPLCTLMLTGIKEIVIISTPTDLPNIRKLLGTGGDLGIKLHYETQQEPKGIAQAFLIAEPYLDNEPVTLILGDNLFYGKNVGQELYNRSYPGRPGPGAIFFLSTVPDPERFGIATVISNQIISIKEKPSNPISNLAVTGLYMYPSGTEVVKYTKTLTPSHRGELEITDLNNMYVKEQRAFAVKLGKGNVWMDMGTFEALYEASSFIRILQNKLGTTIGDPYNLC